MLPTQFLNGDQPLTPDGLPQSQSEETITHQEYPPLSDHNSWYYPSHGHFSEDEDDELYNADSHVNNWGKKSAKGARFIHRRKICSWGPDMEEWEAEERARKRLKQVLPPPPSRSPSPPTLPHLRPDTPPLVSPYCPPITQHLSYSSYVMDKAVTHSFRSNLLNELEASTNGLIEGEATLRRVLGRLWQVMSEDGTPRREHSPVMPKQEDEDGDEASDEITRRLMRAPDLTPTTHHLFFRSLSSNGEEFSLATYAAEQENLERTMAGLYELQDDMREYVERLEEIRESLGEVREQRDRAWDVVRERAIKELQETARASI